MLLRHDMRSAIRPPDLRYPIGNALQCSALHGIPCPALRRSYGPKLSPAVLPAIALHRACGGLFAARYSRTKKSPTG